MSDPRTRRRITRAITIDLTLRDDLERLFDEERVP
jgi:hypothetical protein